MKVAKFGGGCLRVPADFINIANILREGQSESTVLVVSAVFGVTDQLHNSTEFALRSEESIPLSIANIRTQHLEIIEQAIDNSTIRDRVKNSIEKRLKKLERLLYGVAYIGEITASVLTLILSQGERLAVDILTGVLNDQELNAEALESDIIGIVTDCVFENATVNMPTTRTNLQDRILPLLDEDIIPVITGFFGCNESGQPTSFGRNGSDYSAAIIAHCLNAPALDIWKDVNGFMTTDPEFTESAVSITHLSYDEAAELSYFGAKILHPRTVEPLRGSNIEIRIRNIRNPDGFCTTILPDGFAKEDVIKSVTCNSDIAVLKVRGAGVGFMSGIIGEIGNQLSRLNINIHSVITSQTCINLLVDAKDAKMSKQTLEPLVGGVIERIDVSDDVALIAIVGEGVITTKGLAARVFSAVAASGVNVEMFSAGASDVAYYFIVQQDDMNAAIQAVHRSFFEEQVPT
ncbi:aspartate kinase [Candidatus Thorarchaeota archaeon]|nr:MAG: aspartate kinase [Candidatus Thorarchaeota archaeon]